MSAISRLIPVLYGIFLRFGHIRRCKRNATKGESEKRGLKARFFFVRHVPFLIEMFCASNPSLGVVRGVYFKEATVSDRLSNTGA